MAVIQNATLPQQRHGVTTLAALESTIEAQKLASPSVIVVGDVVQGVAAWAAAPEQSKHAA